MISVRHAMSIINSHASECLINSSPCEETLLAPSLPGRFRRRSAETKQLHQSAPSICSFFLRSICSYNYSSIFCLPFCLLICSIFLSIYLSINLFVLYLSIIQLVCFFFSAVPNPLQSFFLFINQGVSNMNEKQIC